MRRREFIGGLSVAGMASPLAARAQQPTLPVIGFLHSASPAGYAEFVTAFQQGLAEVGFAEGRNVATEYRWADGAYDRLPALAAELARLQPTVIFANNPGALHVKAATTTIPIVFTAGFDPIELGLVTNLKQPGGNITGVSILNVELGPKRLEFLHELVVGAVMALLVNPTNPNVPSQTREVQAAAQRLGPVVLLVCSEGRRRRSCPALRATSHGIAQKSCDTLLIGDVAFPGKSSPPFGGAKPPGKTRNANR